MSDLILGIDLALSNTGLAVLQASTDGYELIHADTIRTEPKTNLIERSQQLYKGLLDAVTPWVNQGACIGVEIPAGSQSANASKALAAATSVFGCFLTHIPGVSVVLYTSHSIKKFVGSPEVKGIKRKPLNINKVAELYPNNPLQKKQGKIMAKEEHKADAVIIAHMTTLEDYRGKPICI